MSNTCFENPVENLIVLRKWHIQYCEGDVVAAKLLSFFDYWHSFKLKRREIARKENNIQEMHGDSRTQNESLYQFHTTEELLDGIMCSSKNTINKSIEYLESKGAISIHKNPNPRYKFDKTRYFLLHVEVIESWLKDYKENQGAKKAKLNCQLCTIDDQNESTVTQNWVTETQNRPSNNRDYLQRLSSENIKDISLVKDISKKLNDQEVLVNQEVSTYSFYPIEPVKKRAAPVCYERLDDELKAHFTQESIRRYLEHKKEVKHKISQATLENHLKQCLRAFKWGCIDSPVIGLEIAIENAWQGCRAEWIKNYKEKDNDALASYEGLTEEQQGLVSKERVDAFIAHKKALNKPMTLQALKDNLRAAQMVVDKGIPQVPRIDNVLRYIMTKGMADPNPLSPMWDNMLLNNK